MASRVEGATARAVRPAGSLGGPPPCRLDAGRPDRQQPRLRPEPNEPGHADARRDVHRQQAAAAVAAELAPSQAARLAEILDFLAQGLTQATENIQAKEDGTQVTLSFADWQRVLAIQMLLARYLAPSPNPKRWNRCLAAR